LVFHWLNDCDTSSLVEHPSGKQINSPCKILDARRHESALASSRKPNPWHILTSLRKYNRCFSVHLPGVLD
jgi:hypothetical protein